MLRALGAAPGSPDVLLALGVSHVNELHEGEAVDYLMQCVPPATPVWSAYISSLHLKRGVH